MIVNSNLENLEHIGHGLVGRSITRTSDNSQTNRSERMRFSYGYLRIFDLTLESLTATKCQGSRCALLGAVPAVKIACSIRSRGTG